MMALVEEYVLVLKGGSFDKYSLKKKKNRALHVAPGVQENNTIGSTGIVIPDSESMCAVRREECLRLTSVRPDFLVSEDAALNRKKKCCQFDCHLPEI